MWYRLMQVKYPNDMQWMRKKQKNKTKQGKVKYNHESRACGSNMYSRNNYYKKMKMNSKTNQREKEKDYVLSFECIKTKSWNNFKIKWNESQKQANVFYSTKEITLED